jgi:flagellar basal body-associated protein FliL
MSNNFEEEAKKKEREEELKREAKGSQLMISLVILALFIAVCGAIWFAVYKIRSNQIDNYINNIEYVNNDETESSDLAVKLVTVTIDDVDYTLNQLKDKTDLPTVVDVVVTYTDNSTVTKSAYISYVDSTDVKEVSYQDNEYGRILIPKEMEK